MVIHNGNIYRQRQGFTLVEILLALTISSILILGINAAYQQAYLIWSNIENRRPIYHTTRVVTETLRQEISCLYIPSAVKDKNDEEVKDNITFKLLYLPDQGTELTFYTLTQSWKGTLESSRITRVSYTFIKAPESQNNNLVRSETLCAGDRIIGEADSDVVSNNLSEFRVWAIDPNSGNSWIESYESKDTPPKALKLSLKWAATDKTPETEFESCIFISCNSPVL